MFVFVVNITVVGDPLGATTHTDLILRAKEAVPHQVVHNASILNAIDCCGLQASGKKIEFKLKFSV